MQVSRTLMKLLIFFYIFRKSYRLWDYFKVYLERIFRSNFSSSSSHYLWEFQQSNAKSNANFFHYIKGLLSQLSNKEYKGKMKLIIFVIFVSKYSYFATSRPVQLPATVSFCWVLILKFLLHFFVRLLFSLFIYSEYQCVEIRMTWENTFDWNCTK